MHYILLATLLLTALFTGCNNLTDLDAITHRSTEDAGIEDESVSGGSDADLANNNRVPSEDAGGNVDALADTSLGEDADPPDADTSDAEPDTSIVEDAGVDVEQDASLDAEVDAAPDVPDEMCSEDQLAICPTPRCMEIASCAPETGQCTYAPSPSCVAQGEPCGAGVECFSGACGGDGICGGAGAACNGQSECISGTDCTAGICERTGAGSMVFVEGGESVQGFDCEVCNLGPLWSANVSGFWIDITEVRVDAYETCIGAGACTAPSTTDATAGCTSSSWNNWMQRGVRPSHPINCVDWAQAAAFCRWVGKRLPTEAEWEKAARGAEGRTYPWGEEPVSCDYAVMQEIGAGCGQGYTSPVGSKPLGASPYGGLDMSGNVEEWVADWYAGRRPTDDLIDPQGPTTGTGKTQRGGSFWSTAPAALWSSSRRGPVATEAPRADVGFRCARSAP